MSPFRLEDKDLEDRGIVREVQGSRALVEVKKSSLCEGCNAEASCRIISDEGTRQVWADNNASARVGDRVVLSIDDVRVLKGSFIFYLVPIFFLFIGAGFGKILSNMEALTAGVENMLGPTLAKFITSTDNLSVLTGVMFLLASFMGIWLYSRRASRSGEFRPEVTEVLEMA